MKERVILISIGLFLGIVPAGILWWAIRGGDDGGSFVSVRELQTRMLERDERDRNADGSVSFRSIIAPHPDPGIMYDLRPNLRVQFQGVEVTTNSAGMRERELEPLIRGNAFKIALLGDSFAFGWGVRAEESFGRTLENELSRKGSDTSTVRVINYGVPGYSTFQEIERFLAHGVEYDFDMVLVYFVVNDFGLPFFIGNSTSSGNLLLDAARFAALTDKTEDPTLAAERRALEHRLDPNRELRRFSRILRARGTKLFVALNPGSGWNEMKRKLWITESDPTVRPIFIRDALKAIIAERGYTDEELKLPTDPHPSALKHRLIGELLAQELRPWVVSE